jgi:hypothetical protein
VIPFGTEKNICIGPDVVYWQGKVRALSLLFAASAAAQFTSASTDKREQAVPDRKLAERREAIESFRLCDTNKAAGHLNAGLCKAGEPSSAITLPSEACVNQD